MITGYAAPVLMILGLVIVLAGLASDGFNATSEFALGGPLILFGAAIWLFRRNSEEPEKPEE